MLKRLISGFICMAMLISLIPVQAIALETVEPAALILETEPVAEETVTTEEEPESVEEEPEPTEEETEPVVEEPAAPTEEETEPVEEETEPAEEETEPAEEEPEPAEEPEPTEEQLPLEELEPEPKLADAADNSCGANATWAFDEGTGTLTISGTGAMTDYASFTDLPFEPYRSQIRTVIIADGITSIGNKAFNSCGNLSSITIPDSVVSIGANAFSGCSSLTSIELPVGVKTIGTLAFDGCRSLSTVVIPDGVEEIAVHAFRYCSALEEITIPGTVTHIAEKTFEECESLTTVIIEEGVTSIGERAFDYCYGLINLSLPSSIQEIGAYAFHSCYSLQSVVIPAGVTSINQCVFAGCSSLQTIELPQTLLTIGEGAFVDCSGLTELDIPGSVTAIGSRAFMGCGSLESITIPSGVTSIESETFLYCENLAEIVFEGDAPAFAEDAFSGVATVAKYPDDNATWTDDAMQSYGGEVIWLPVGQATSGTCGDNLTWVYDMENRALTIFGTGPMADYSPENPAPWHKLGAYVYGLTLESGVTTIGEYAFADLSMLGGTPYGIGSSLSVISLPETLTSIGAGAFSGCSDALNAFIVPAAVTQIGADAFAGCTSLKNITFLGNLPTLADTLFSEDMTLTARYPAENATWTAADRKNYGGNVTWYGCDEDGNIIGTCGDGLTWTYQSSTNNTGKLTISGTGAMTDYSPEDPAPWQIFEEDIRNLIIEAGVTSIGSYAFAGMSRVGYAASGGFGPPTASNIITLPASVETIGEGAFYDCPNLKKIQFLGDLPQMGGTIFSDGMTVTALYPDGKASWTEEARNSCGGTITWYRCDENGAVLEGTCGSAAVWSYDSASATLTISGSGDMTNYAGMYGSSTTPPWDALKTKVEKIVIETGITSIGGRSFAGFTALKTMTIPNTVVSIGTSAFANCSSLELEIPAGVSNLGNYALQGVKALHVAEANENYASTDGMLLSKDGTILLYAAAAQASYVIPSTVTVINDEAFCQNPNLTVIVIPGSVESIGNAAFAGCPKLESVILEGTPVEIWDYAFADCYALTSIRFMAAAPGYIYGSAFSNVTATAYYPENNATWTIDAIQQYGGSLTWEVWQAPTSGTCGENLTWEYMDDGSLAISGTSPMTDYGAGRPAPWSDLSENIYAIFMDTGVTTIGDYAFADMPNIQAILLPDGLTKIGEGAFSGCSSYYFTNIAVPAAVQQIGKNAFANCIYLEEISFLGDMPAMTEPLFSEDMTLVAYYPADNETWAALDGKDFGGNVTWITVDASGNPAGTCGDDLTWTLRGSGLTISGTGAMTDYSPENPAPWYALANRIYRVTIGSGVTSIGSYAFADLPGLYDFTVPATIAEIGENAFYGCGNLSRIDFLGDLPNLAETIFSEDMMLSCYYPYSNITWTEEARKNYGGSVRWYGLDENGNEMGGACGDSSEWHYEPASATLTITGSGEMYSGSWYALIDKIEKVVLESGITVIGDSVFSDFFALKEVILPDTLQKINYEAFARCANLETAVIPSGVTSLGAGAFKGCVKLSLHIPTGMNEIAGRAVQDVKALSVDTANDTYTVVDSLLLSKDKTRLISYTVPKTTYTIPETVTTIGEAAFGECNDLVQITIHDSVQTIETYAFADCVNLTTVDLPQGITVLEHRVFAGAGLTEITIPDSVEKIDIRAFEACEKLEKVVFAGEPKVHTIDYCAFDGCTSLKTMELPASVTTLGDYAFSNTALTKIRIPDTMKVIGSSVFAYCHGLETVAIEGKLDELGWEVFDSCSNLKSIRFMGDAPAFIGDYAFVGVYYSTNVYYPGDNATWTEDVLQDYGGSVNWSPWETSTRGSCGEELTWQYDEWNGILTISGTGAMADYTEEAAPWSNLSIKSIVLEEGITSIGSYAFVDTGLTQISLPAGLVSIGECALPRQLTSLDIPASLTSVYFENLDRLERFNVADGNTAYAAVDGVLFSADMTRLIRMPERWVTDWDEKSFVEYTVPDTVVELCDKALYGCDFLKNVILPESLEIIGERAICCLGTGTVYGPETIILPRNVTSIGTDALASAKLVVFAGDAPTMAEKVFSTCAKTAYYPAGNATWTEDKLLDYGGELTWIPYETDMPTSGTLSDTIGWRFDEETATLIVSGTGVMSGYHYAYMHSDFITPWLHLTDRIEHVVIEDGITEIGNGIFKNHHCLETVTLPASLRIICDSAFRNNPALREVKLPEGLLTIEQGAFENCTALESIRIPDTVTSIGAYAFFNCTGLTMVELSAGITQLNDCTFAGCSALAEIRIPANVTSIGSCVFEGCTALKKVEFAGDAPVIVCSAFNGVTAVVFYPADKATWTDEVLLNYGGSLTWNPVMNVENRVALKSEELGGHTSVWIDGREYPVKTTNGIAYVDLPGTDAKTMVTYTYQNAGDADVHTHIPIGMTVWALTNTDGFYTATRVEALDNVLGYAGCSIRVKGNQGIRMITSMDAVDKAALTGAGLAGYTLEEYGTAIAWASQLGTTKPLTLGKSYVSSNYAYKKGVADPIYYNDGNVTQYTNVLVGFSLDQCSDDIAMRPYMILKDASGNEITLYGAIVERSIGYIALQNKDRVEAGTEAYDYIMNIINHVYGEA